MGGWMRLWVGTSTVNYYFWQASSLECYLHKATFAKGRDDLKKIQLHLC